MGYEEQRCDGRVLHRVCSTRLSAHLIPSAFCARNPCRLRLSSFQRKCRSPTTKPQATSEDRAVQKGYLRTPLRPESGFGYSQRVRLRWPCRSRLRSVAKTGAWLKARGSRFFLGLDLGQARDYSVIAFVECRIELTGARGAVTYIDHTRTRLIIRHLERIPLRTEYPDVVERIRAVAQSYRGGTYKS